MKLLSNNRTKCGGGRLSAFSMLEVVIASAIFFMVAFSILALVTSSLASARRLQQRQPDPGLVAAALSMTNILVEEVVSGDFEDIAPGLYPGYRWQYEPIEVLSNGLFEVTIVVFNTDRRGPSQSELKILMYRPESPPGSASDALGF